MKDRNIIALQKKGEYEQAFNAIVDAYSERLYWHLRKFIFNHEDTDDLLQEVFLKIWRALPFFRGDSQIFTWAYRIATNEALNFLNRSKSKALIDVEVADAMISEKMDEDPYFSGTAMQRELYKAVQTLPEKQRVVFNLRYYDEMKYEDMSKITGTSVGALKASYHHAYNKVSEIMKKIFMT
jgi:RNA polymerase sigma-70 factor (ECF subfamily)